MIKKLIKSTSIILCLIVLAITLSSCGLLTDLDSGYIRAVVETKGQTVLSEDLSVEQAKDTPYNSSVYLTKDKFIFTTQDDNSNFGDQQMPMVYDLKTGKITKMVNFDTGGIDHCHLVGNDLYFVSYSKTTNGPVDASHGFCFFKYNLESGDIDCVYETPNTVSFIFSECIDDTIFYFASTTTQEELEDNIETYQLHILKNGKDTIVKDNIKTTIPDMIKADDKIGVYFNTVMNNDFDTEKTYFTDMNGKTEETDKSLYEMEEKNQQEEHEHIDDKIISGKFGDYYILEDEIPSEEDGKNAGDCGYQYTINYYLYNVNTKETQTLTSATYWHYYI